MRPKSTPLSGNMVFGCWASACPPSYEALSCRRGRPAGEYGNGNGQLPGRPLGYYTESDVWPSGRGTGNRGSERLVFGGEGRGVLHLQSLRQFHPASMRSWRKVEETCSGDRSLASFQRYLPRPICFQRLAETRSGVA
ncbi:ribonuclease domain-containing protein [Streptomyces sp. E11-3]|uniref:ribonuclease domain-containing protein n=1 Tax=Streptomyces sp. E11-3 TaxID=3110112 RepID=UPI00397F173D